MASMPGVTVPVLAGINVGLACKRCCNGMHINSSAPRPPVSADQRFR
jgi:hypothetical protein